jgi:hypothetical protein
MPWVSPWASSASSGSSPQGLDRGQHGSRLQEIWTSYNLTVIPMFVFMGSVAFYAGMSGRLYDASYTIFGKWRGTGHGHGGGDGRVLGDL